ncbi:MAG TPA: PilZ domain-containing protein [Piscirickettsiaceae bacterium]|nr:PilZ domain-containing protein [Piscirickettsiaceae bacterium]HIQ40059.1 PilZ domain-containing protein [Sulfurivirga caldicuralii]
MDGQHTAQRVTTNRPVKIIGGNRQVKGRLVGISLHDAALESPAKASPGTRLELVFDLPAGDHFATLKLFCIVRSHTLHNDKHLLRVEWDNPSDSDLAEIQAFIDYKIRLKKSSIRGAGTQTVP